MDKFDSDMIASSFWKNRRAYKLSTAVESRNPSYFDLEAQWAGVDGIQPHVCPRVLQTLGHPRKVI